VAVSLASEREVEENNLEGSEEGTHLGIPGRHNVTVVFSENRVLLQTIRQ
jgi:hypothetical protein